MPRRLLILLVAAYLAAKLPFVLFSPYTFDEEEVKPGAIGYVILNGAELPLWEYIPVGFEAGNLVVGLISVPPQAVFGPRFAVSKALAVLVGLGVMLLSAGILYRLSGVRGAAFAGAMLIVSPPYLTQFLLLLQGTFLESVFLSLLVIYLFARYRTADEPGRLAPFWIGLAGGFAVFFHYACAVAVIAVAVTWYFQDHRLFARRGFWLFVLGLGIGFAPWIAYNVALDFRGLDRLAGLGSGGGGLLEHTGRNLIALFATDIPMSWHFKDLGAVSGKTLAYAYTAFVLAGLGGTLVVLRGTIIRSVAGLLPLKRFDLPGGARSTAVVLPVYLAGYFAVYAGSEFGLYRPVWGSMDPETHTHLLNALFVLLLCVAYAAAEAPRAWVRFALVVPPLAVACAGSAALLDWRHANTGLLARSYAPYVDAVYSEVGRNYGTTGDAWGKTYENLSLHPRISFAYGLGAGMAYVSGGRPADAVERCRSIPDPEFAAVCTYGVWSGWFEQYELDPEARDVSLSNLSDEDRGVAAAGAAEILLMTGYDEHPVIEEARAYVTSAAFAERFPTFEIRHFMRSRVAARGELSEKR